MWSLPAGVLISDILGSVVDPARAGYCLVERLDRARRANNERGARVNSESIRFGQCRLPRTANTNIVSKPVKAILLPTMALALGICQCPIKRMMRDIHGRMGKVLTGTGVDIVVLEASAEE